ncbi:S49 family peptidase [Simkania sp.]|uniref:S49 family peptidase n=1 Tax=Simkania sp. TaxID=34094 RepID=UPI003B523C20
MNVTRESIFISALRTFCNSLSGMFGILIGLIIIGVIFVFASKPAMVSDKTTMIIAADADGNRSLLPESSPAILRINIHGEIGTRDLNAKLLQTQLLDSREGALKHNRVKAILLHINSPGGTVDDANNMYMSLVEYKQKYKVPIYAYVDGMCASGAMYIACSADKILSNPTGIIGSVGVIMGPNFNVSGLMEKYGVSQVTLTEGKDKDMLSPYRPWKPGEDDSLKAILTYDYERFTNIVSKNRPKINKQKLINEYGAQVFDPIKAQELGYVDDGNSSYNSALSELVNQAKIDSSYQVVELKVPHPILSDLIEGQSPLFSGKIKHEIQLSPAFKSEWMNRPLYLYSPALTTN